MLVTVVQNENLPFTRVFELVLYIVQSLYMFLRVVKMTRAGEEMFFTVYKFGLGSINQG